MSRTSIAATLFAWSLVAASPAAASESKQPVRVTVGQQAPAFSLPGTDGKTYAPGDLRARKNLVLIFFRGTW